MKFAHIADCHIGSWRDPRLKDISLQAFEKSVDKCIEENIDFILISGDLFNTSLPQIDHLKRVVLKLKKLKDKNIPVYGIVGSHDFSPSGKTVVDVLENAGLFVNVVKGEVIDEKLKLKFTVDSKTNVKITGLLGKRGMLERKYYENLIRENLESEQGFKIFMFHTAITELKPKELEKMASAPISFLPKNFDYYAGGHVHIVKDISLENYKNIVYPGPLFPNNFAELEKLERGGFYIYDNGQLRYEPITIKNHEHIELDCNHLTPEQVKVELLGKVKDKEFINTIVSLRLKGTLESGKVSDIDFKEIYRIIYGKGAYFLMKNTNALKTKEFEEIKIDTKNIDELEDSIIKEHLGQVSFLEREKEITLTKELITHLNTERKEGERVTDFEKRLLTEVDEMLVSNN